MRILVLVALLVGSVSVFGGSYTLGEGTRSCGEWTQERNEGDWYTKGQWIHGYVSADSFYRDIFDWAPAEKPDPAGILAWVDNYCGENPLDLMRDAARALAVELPTTMRSSDIRTRCPVFCSSQIVNVSRISTFGSALSAC